MGLQSASVTLVGKVASYVTDLEIDGTAVTLSSNGTYQVTLPITQTEQLFAMTTSHEDGTKETRFLTTGRQQPPLPKAEG